MKKIEKAAIVSPSVMCSGIPLDAGKWLPYLKECGLETVMMPTSLEGTRLTTFQARDKARDIMEAYTDGSIDALIAVHGGASSLRVLEYLDFTIIRQHNKPIIGFSDTTTLQCAVYALTGHPYITGFLPEYDFRKGQPGVTTDKCFRQVLSGKKFAVRSGKTVHPGTVEGVLIGGTLASLMNLAGTIYFPDLNGKILLLEDVDESAYKLKQMLTQLRYVPTFSGVKGIIFGCFADCRDHITHGTVESVVDDFAAQTNLPIIKDFNYGHCPDRLVLTCGITYRLDAGTCILEQIGE